MHAREARLLKLNPFETSVRPVITGETHAYLPVVIISTNGNHGAPPTIELENLADAQYQKYAAWRIANEGKETVSDFIETAKQQHKLIYVDERQWGKYKFSISDISIK